MLAHLFDNRAWDAILATGEMFRCIATSNCASTHTNHPDFENHLRSAHNMSCHEYYQKIKHHRTCAICQEKIQLDKGVMCSHLKVLVTIATSLLFHNSWSPVLKPVEVTSVCVPGSEIRVGGSERRPHSLKKAYNQVRARRGKRYGRMEQTEKSCSSDHTWWLEVGSRLQFGRLLERSAGRYSQDNSRHA